MNLRYTPEAIADLREMKTYITKVLHNAQAAKRITASILDACSALKTFPELGTPLEMLTGQASDVRYLVCENRMVFYRAEDGCVLVARVLDGRTDYLRVLMK